MNRKTLAVFALLAVFAVGTLCASPLQSGISACYTGRITGENLSDAQKYALGIEARFNAAFLALTADFTVRPDLGGADLFASANIRKTVGFLDFATGVGLRVGFGRTADGKAGFNGLPWNRFGQAIFGETLYLRSTIGVDTGTWNVSASFRMPVGRLVDGITGRDVPEGEWNGQMSIALLKNL